LDGLLILLIGAVLCILPDKSAEVHTENVLLPSMLNPRFLQDEQAFMRIANELGFY
jgi:hypothetical protein